MATEDFKSLLQVSTVLTNELLSNALTEWFKEPVTFTHWEYVGDIGKGDFYLSEVIRIKIHGDASGISKHVQVVLKSIPKNVCRRLTFRSDEFFRNEINFYEKVIPTLMKFQSTKNISEPFTGFTKLFLAYSDGLNDVICLEDANLENFGSYAARQAGIDIEHCKVTMKALAQYHALSFALKDQDPDAFDRISDAVFETYYDPRLWHWYGRFWRRICGIAIDAIEKEHPDSIYLEKVKKFSVPERYEDMIRAVRDKTHGVMSHGDSWTNNFLYKYENNRAVGAKIIDFQLTRCASPVLDIVFFIYACTEQDLREKYYDELLKYYYEILSKQIKELGSDPNKVYSWETFMHEVKKYSYFGLAFSFESTPCIVLAPEDAVNMDMEYVGEAAKGDFYTSEVIRIKIHGDATSGISKHVQVVLKNIPKNVCRRLTFRSDEFFRNEINFYQKVAPVLLKFQSTKNVKEPFAGFAKLFLAYSDGLNDIICLEDANLENFGSHAARQAGIDIEHCKVTMKVLAQYHALSFALRDQDPETFNRMTDAIFESYYDPRLWDWYKRFWHRLCCIAVDAVEKEYPDSIYLQKIKEFAVPERYEDMIRAVRDKTHGVMSHGDSWTSNFLYKYENNRPIDAKMIDFQLNRCASPVLDLTYFIYACTDQDLRQRHYDELLKYYYKALSEQIKELGSDPEKVYSWDTFIEEVRKYSYFGLAFSFESTPFIILAPEDAISMDIESHKKLNIEDFWSIPPIKSKEGRLREANNVVHCVDKGYI